LLKSISSHCKRFGDKRFDFKILEAFMNLSARNLLILISMMTLFGVQASLAQVKKSKKATPKAKVIVPKPLTFEQMIFNTQDLLNRNDFAKAFEQAKSAISANPENYLGYYFASQALFVLNNLAEAKNYANESLTRLANPSTQTLANLPSVEKSEIERLLLNISNLQAGTEFLKLAEEAIQKGNEKEAAEKFEKAYQFLPNREEIGIRAARIYLFNLEKPAKSIEILKLVLLRTADNTSESIRVAAELLEKAQRQIADAKLMADDEARKNLELQIKKEALANQKKALEAEKARTLEADRLRNEAEKERLAAEKKSRDEASLKKYEHTRELEWEISNLESKIRGYENEISSYNYWLSYYEKGQKPESANEYRKKLRLTQDNLSSAKTALVLLKEQLRRVKYSN
jgi:tetratricopeptide (TPR) repeat protein